MVAQVYLMRKFTWSLSKTLEFLVHRKPDLLLTKDILHAFQQVEGMITHPLPTPKTAVPVVGVHNDEVTFEEA